MWDRIVRITQKLGEIIRSQAQLLGDTDTGREWCLKALHPSDPATTGRGIPDGATGSSVILNYMSTYTLGPSSGSEGAWSFDMTLTPNPLVFGAALIKDSVSPSGAWTSMPNSQVSTAPGFLDRYAAFKKMARRWRLSYMSATVLQDSPDLTNGGTLIAAQIPTECITLTSGQLKGTVKQATLPINSYFLSDMPSFELLQGMPEAYCGPSRDGVYMPIHLDRIDNEWRSPANDRLLVSAQGMSESTVCTPIPTIAQFGPWPYPSVTCAFNDGTSVGGDTCPADCNSKFGYISARNLNSTATIVVTIRAGFEVQCGPSSPLAPQLMPPGLYDPMAIRVYTTLVRSMKDAYPADYNDLGKLWNVVMTTARRVLPHIINVGRLTAPLLAATPLGPQGVALANAGLDVLSRMSRRPPRKDPNQKNKLKSTSRGNVG